MKKIIIICIFIFCLITLQTNAQLLDTTANMHRVDANTLLLKSKKQKSTGWILLGCGAGLATAGGIIVAAQVGNGIQNVFNPNHSSSNSSGGVIMACAGVGAILGSIPLFIASHKNKKTAKLEIQNQTISLAPSGMNKQLALTIKIGL